MNDASETAQVPPTEGNEDKKSSPTEGSALHSFAKSNTAMALLLVGSLVAVGGTIHWMTSGAIEAQIEQRRVAIAQERLRDATCKEHPEQASANALVAQACARAAAIGRYGQAAIAIDLKLCESAPAGSPFCKGVTDKAAELWKSTDELMKGR